MSDAIEQPKENLPQTHEELINDVIAEMLRPKNNNDNAKEIDLFLEDIRLDANKLVEMFPPLTEEEIAKRHQFEEYMNSEKFDTLCGDFNDIIGHEFKPTWDYIKRKYHVNNQNRSSSNRKQKRIKITKTKNKIKLDYKNTLIKKFLQILNIQ